MLGDVARHERAAAPGQVRRAGAVEQPQPRRVPGRRARREERDRRAGELIAHPGRGQVGRMERRDQRRLARRRHDRWRALEQHRAAEVVGQLPGRVQRRGDDRVHLAPRQPPHLARVRREQDRPVAGGLPQTARLLREERERVRIEEHRAPGRGAEHAAQPRAGGVVPAEPGPYRHRVHRRGRMAHGVLVIRIDEDRLGDRRLEDRAVRLGRRQMHVPGAGARCRPGDRRRRSGHPAAAGHHEHPPRRPLVCRRLAPRQPRRGPRRRQQQHGRHMLLVQRREPDLDGDDAATRRPAGVQHEPQLRPAEGDRRLRPDHHARHPAGRRVEPRGQVQRHDRTPARVQRTDRLRHPAAWRAGRARAQDAVDQDVRARERGGHLLEG